MALYQMLDKLMLQTRQRLAVTDQPIWLTACIAVFMHFCSIECTSSETGLDAFSIIAVLNTLKIRLPIGFQHRQQNPKESLRRTLIQCDQNFLNRGEVDRPPGGRPKLSIFNL